MTLAGVLERRFGPLSDAATQAATEELAPAIRSGSPTAVAEALERVERRLEGALPDRDVADGAADVARRVDRHHRRLFYPALAAAIGATILGADERTLPAGGRPRGGGLVLAVKLKADPMLLAEQFAARNVKLIKTMRREVLPALRDEVVRAVQFDITPDQAAARLADKWRRKGVPIARGNMKPRLRLIARDQVSKLHAEVSRSRQVASGIERFAWISQRDDRVRPLHEDIDGNIYTWRDGHPTEGLPGEPVMCRCFADTVIDRQSVLQAPGFITLSSAEVQLSA